MNKLDEIRARDADWPDRLDEDLPRVYDAPKDRRDLLRIIDAAENMLVDAPCQCISADDMCGCCRALRILRGEE